MKVINSESEYQKMITEARHFYMAAPVVLPLLEKRRNEAYGRLMSSFKAGKADNMTIVAELSVINDLEREFVTKLKTYEAEEEKYANRDRS